MENFKPVRKKLNQNFSSTLVLFERSKKRYQHVRHFYKILDAFSYIGGMFQSIIGVLLILTIFSGFFFEINFAKHYFRSGILKSFKKYSQAICL